MSECTRCGRKVEDEYYKRCEKCRDHLIAYYNERGRRLRGYSFAKKYRRARRNSIGLLELECTVCKDFKDETSFRRSQYHRFGRHTICNSCLAKQTPAYIERVYRAMRKKEITESAARYYCSRGSLRPEPKKEKYKIHPWKEKNKLSFWKKVA
jgi:hypothetical protein